MIKRVKHVFEFGPFRLDTAERLLLRDGKPVPLTPKAFDTLLVLVENSGHLVEKDELIDRLWPDTFVEEVTLARNISDLRKALGEAHKYIETVPKRGYRFMPSVIELGNDGAELVLEEHTRSHVVIEEEKEQAQDQHSQRAAAISQAFESSVRAWIIKPLILASTLLVVAATLYFLRQSGDMRRKPENLVTPTHKQMSFIGNALFPSLSADGKFIAYVSDQSEGGQRVMVQEVKGGQAIEVLNTRRCVDMRWSPDGSELLVIAGSDLLLVPRLGGSPRRLGGAGFACWSPDGSQIAVSAYPMKVILLRDKLTGKNTPIRLEGSFQWVTDLDWSPTSDWLLFSTSENNARNTIWTIRSDGTRQQKVFEDNGTIISPRWSGEGNAIYFLRDKEQAKELWRIPVAPATGQSKTPASAVLTGLQAGSFFTIARDEKRLLYTRELNYSNLWLATLEGSEEGQRIQTKQLTTGTSPAGSPSISPDGKWIAFAMNSNIYKISIEGGSAQQVTFWDSHNDTPAWSPDGKWIAFTSDQGGSGKIWLVSSEGGPPHQFVESELGNSCEIAWAPGANILYQRPGNRNFDILNPSTGEARPLANDDSVGWMGSACNSPNGNKVAVHWNRKPKGIWVISLDGYSETLVYGDANRQYWPLGWSTDGNWIYVSEPSDGVRKILKVPVTGGEPRSVANLPFDKIEYLSVTADGKKSVFTVRERKSDVWLAEDFDRYIP